MKNLCINCQLSQRKDKYSHFCQECFDKEITNKIINEDRVVESPHNSWF